MGLRCGLATAVAVTMMWGWMRSAAAEQSGSVALRVDTGGALAAAGTPVSGGVPFPIGAVATVDHLRLQTSQGTTVSANYRALSTWPDGSVKSALISFVPTPQVDTYPAFVLQYGPTVSHSATGPVQVTQDSTTLTVTSDVLKLQVSKQRFSVLEQVWSDLDSDGTFSTGEQWLSGAADLVVVDKKTGRTFKTSLWTSGDGYAPRLVEAGPYKVTLLLEGRLKGVNGGLTADGDTTLAQAKVWLSVYAGSSLVHVQTTLVDTKSRSAESFSSRILDLSGVTLEAPLTLANMSYAAGGESGAVYQGLVNSQAALLQDANVTFNGQFSYGFFYNGVGSGAKAPGWMDVSDPSGRGITMGLRHFWQTFPHKLSVSGNVLKMDFVPADSPRSFWTVYPGVGKTYEGFLDFHGGTYSTAVRRRAELALVPPLLMADPAWYTATQAFGPLAPRSSYSGHYDAKMENQYRCIALRQGCTIEPQVYGQRDFGDYQRGFGGSSPEYGDGHYEDAHGWLLQFARTGERKWFDYAAPAARHHYDLDVMHTQNSPRFPGFPAGMIHWHGTGEHEGPTTEMGHIVPGGLSEYYLLTGDPRALDVLREQGDWIEYWARSGYGRIAPERTGDPIGLEEYERVGAWTLHTALASYEATGDPKYWEAASILVKNTIDWWKMPQDLIVFDPGRQLDLSQSPQSQALYYLRSDWTAGSGYPLPTLRVDNCSTSSAPYNNYAYQTHVPIAWMSGLLQTSLIQYYQNLERFGGNYSASVTYRGQATSLSVDTATMREMFVQLIKLVVDHSYLGAPTHASLYPWLSSLGYNHFVYSACPERDPRVEDGGQYLQWPLAFISSFVSSDVSSRWQGTWSQLQAKWRDIAKIQYTVRVVNDAGPRPGYNGAPDLWNMPYAVARMEQLGLLNDFGGGGGGGGTPPPPPPPPPSAGSLPAYAVSLSGGGAFVTNPIIDLKFVAPSEAVQVNISTSGFGQGSWQDAVTELHGLTLPAGSGAKTLYVQFRNSAGAILASLTKSIVLIEPGFSGDVTLTLNEAEDTYVFGNSAGSNFGAAIYVSAGRYYETGYDHDGLLRFGLPAPPAGVRLTVRDASLEMYLIENTRNASQVISPYEVTSAWSEDAVTWNSRPSMATSAMGSGVLFTDRSEINRWKVFPLQSAAIQRWLQDATSNRGVCLFGDGTPGLTSVQLVSSESFHPSEDRRPRLKLTLTVNANDTTPPVISGLQAVTVGQTTATIQWTTNEAADGLVEYGTTAAYGSAAPLQTALSTDHSVLLQGLSPQTLYHVRVRSRDAAGNTTTSSDVTFTTAAGTLAGDMNGDGQLTLADLPGLLSQLLGVSPVTPENADVNADGRVTIADLQVLVNRLQ